MQNTDKNDVKTAIDSTTEPTSYRFTRQQLVEQARNYLTSLYGSPGEFGNSDKWMERYGLLVGFSDYVTPMGD